MQWFSHVDKREVLQQEYSQPPILPSPHFRWVVNSTFSSAQLSPTEGLVRRHSHLKIGRYHQHLQEILDQDMTALDWMLHKFPGIKEREDMRRIIGRYGLTGQQQVSGWIAGFYSENGARELDVIDGTACKP